MIGQSAQIAGHRPARTHAGQCVNPTVFAGESFERDAAEPLCCAEATSTGEEIVCGEHAYVHRIEEAGLLFALLVDRLRAELDEDFGMLILTGHTS